MIFKVIIDIVGLISTIFIVSSPVLIEHFI